MKIKPTDHPGEVVVTLNRRDEPMLASATVEAEPSAFQLKNILVPTDFSECSKKALQYAVPLARQHGASITLLYVVLLPAYAGMNGGGLDFAAYEPNLASIEAEMRENGERDLAKLLVDEVQGTVPTKMLIRTGPPAKEIISAAKELDTDLIILSTHGRTGLKHLFLGSVAEHIVQRAPCPVLVVREEEHDFVGRI